jgi:hypothetical protein
MCGNIKWGVAYGWILPTGRVITGGPVQNRAVDPILQIFLYQFRQSLLAQTMQSDALSRLWCISVKNLITHSPPGADVCNQTRRRRPRWKQTLHRLASPLCPIGKIHPFSKIALTLEPVMQFWCLSRFRFSLKIVYFMTESTISNHWGVAAL